MPKKLLLADDSITIQKVVGITFAQEDYEITYVDNGEDAIKKVYDLMPDIVLADIIMPQKNGYEVCDFIKKDPRLSQTPVLLLAGTFETFDESRGKQAGADGYIIKPFESQALIDKVNELIKKKGAKPQIQEQPKPAAAEPVRQPLKQAAPLIAQPIPPRVGVTPPAPLPDSKFTTLSPRGSGARPVPPTPPPKPVVPPPRVQQFTPPPVAEPPVRDKRMEPLLEFDSPSLSESPIPGFAEVEEPKMEFPESIPLEGGDINDQGIDLASPAEFIMEATGATEASYLSPSPADKKEEVFEVEKPPTFDFVSGESDLSPEFVSPDEPINEGSQISFSEPDLGMKPEQKPMPEMTMDQPFLAPIPEESTSPVAKAEPFGMASAVRIPDDQIEEIVRKVSQNIIEKIAWEIVPDLAERIIKDEISRLTTAPKK